MLKQLFIAVLMIAVGLLGLPSISLAAQSHGKMMMAMEHCDCPPGQSMQDMPCHEDGACPPSLDCLIHCAVATPLATQTFTLRILVLLPHQPLLFGHSPGRLLSSGYPPYRPPQA